MRDEFRNWMIQEDGIAEYIAYQYVTAIDKISEHYNEQTGANLDIYKETDLKKLKEIANEYGPNGKYADFSSFGNGMLRNAIKAYIEFLCQKFGIKELEDYQFSHFNFQDSFKAQDHFKAQDNLNVHDNFKAQDNFNVHDSLKRRITLMFMIVSKYRIALMFMIVSKHRITLMFTIISKYRITLMFMIILILMIILKLRILKITAMKNQKMRMLKVLKLKKLKVMN